MEMKKGILLDVLYNGRLNKVYCKFYDLKDGNIRVWVDNTNYKPYCLTKYDPQEEELEELGQFRGYDGFDFIDKYDTLAEEKIEVARIFAKTPSDIPRIREIVSHTHESKIQFHLNYIYDKQLKIGTYYSIIDNNLKKIESMKDIEALDKCTEITGLNWWYEHQDDPAIFYIFNNVKLLSEEIFNPIRMAMDIEVDGIKDRVPDAEKGIRKIISCSFVSNDGVKFVYLLKRKGKEITNHIPRYAMLCKTEQDLIEKIFKMIRAYPIVITFNGDNFDLQYIYNRAINLGFKPIEIPIRKPRKSYGMYNSTECFLKRGIHIDLYRIFSNRSLKTYAFGNKYERNSLEDISKAFLGIGKVKHEEQIGDMEYSKLAWYNLKDSVLTLELTNFNNNLVWNLIILLCRISSLPIHDLTRHQISYWIKSLMYNEHRRNNYLIPNPEEIKRIKKGGYSKAVIEGKMYKGAFVFEPKIGIHFDAVVMDFASLYPSVIKENNLSYETINCGHKECMEKIIDGIPYHTCLRKIGMLAYVVGFFRDVRVKYYKPLSLDISLSKNEQDYNMTIQQTLKVFINGSYGVFGSINFPFFCLPVAESTTGLAREALKATYNKCKNMKIKVLYGDTDSVFLDNPTKAQTDKLSNWAKKDLDLDLEKEKTYQLLALSHRKKNYIGIHKDTKRIEMKGLTAKKRNTPTFIKTIVGNLNEILKGITNMDEFKKAKANIIHLIKISDKRIGKIGYKLEDYAINITLGKNPDQYIKTTPIYVKAVRNSDKKFIKGDVVSFIKTKSKLGTKLTKDSQLQDIDGKAYKKLLQSSLEQILDALGIKYNEIKGQKTLEGYT